MEATLVILMVLGIFVAIPAVIGFIIVGAFVVANRRAERAKGLELLKPLRKRSVQLAILVFLCLYYPIIYYFGELVDHFGWEALRWDFFYTVHDIHRVFFLIPVLFAAYCFRVKGAVIATAFAFAVFLPRGLLLSQYPDPASRMLVFVIFALFLGIFVGTISNKLERLQQLIDSSKK